MFAPILERGTVIPASRVKTFSTMSDNQKEILVEVFQGEHASCEKNRKLGEYSLRGLPPGPAGSQSIDVRFSYDLNGLLEVDMTILSTGKRETLVVERRPVASPPSRSPIPQGAGAPQVPPARGAPQHHRAGARRRAVRRAGRSDARGAGLGDRRLPRRAGRPGPAGDRDARDALLALVDQLAGARYRPAADEDLIGRGVVERAIDEIDTVAGAAQDLDPGRAREQSLDVAVVDGLDVDAVAQQERILGGVGVVGRIGIPDPLDAAKRTGPSSPV